ncbi:MAG: lysophospholipid acyltransferase family protein [Sphingomicrobium sp.]
MRLNARAAVRIAALILLFLICAPLHLLTKWLLGRSRWPRRFLAACSRVIGARVRIEGSPVAPHTLLVSNHITWLDILLLGGSLGAAFVSKAELGHPLVHWLADQNGSIYVTREQRTAAPEQARAVAEGLRRDQPLTIFPEGTIGPGDRLLPFRSALLAAVAPPPDRVAVRPVAIDYGAAATEISWYGKRGTDNVLEILGRRGTLPVTIHVLEPLSPGADRKQLAVEARERIADALGFKLPAHSPIGLAE